MLPREREIAARVVGRVLAVVGFDRVQSRRGKEGDEIVASGQPRVGHRYDTAGGMNLGEHLSRIRSRPRHERRRT